MQITKCIALSVVSLTENRNEKNHSIIIIFISARAVTKKPITTTKLHTARDQHEEITLTKGNVKKKIS